MLESLRISSSLAIDNRRNRRRSRRFYRRPENSPQEETDVENCVQSAQIAVILVDIKTTLVAQRAISDCPDAGTNSAFSYAHQQQMIDMPDSHSAAAANQAAATDANSASSSS